MRNGLASAPRGGGDGLGAAACGSLGAGFGFFAGLVDGIDERYDDENEQDLDGEHRGRG